MNNLIAFAVCKYNLDVQSEGVHIKVYFQNEDRAIEWMKKDLMSFQPEDIIYDLDGVFDSIRGKSIQYLPCANRKAIYYISHYGSYSCCYFINPIVVH